MYSYQKKIGEVTITRYRHETSRFDWIDPEMGPETDEKMIAALLAAMEKDLEQEKRRKKLDSLQTEYTGPIYGVSGMSGGISVGLNNNASMNFTIYETIGMAVFNQAAVQRVTIDYQSQQTQPSYAVTNQLPPLSPP